MSSSSSCTLLDNVNRVVYGLVIARKWLASLVDQRECAFDPDQLSGEELGERCRSVSDGCEQLIFVISLGQKKSWPDDPVELLNGILTCYVGIDMSAANGALLGKSFGRFEGMFHAFTGYFSSRIALRHLP